MKRNVKRILSLALVLALVLSLTVPAFAENKRTRQNPGIKNIVTFGSSVTYGCAVGGIEDPSDFAYSEKPFIPVPGSYAALLAEYFGGSTTQCARNGWRTVEARVKLENAPRDEVTDFIEWYCDYDPEGKWSNVHTESTLNPSDTFVSAVENADLITLEYGSDELIMNIMVILMKFLEENWAELSETSEGQEALALTEQESVSLFDIEKTLELLKQIDMYAKLIGSMMEAASTGVNEFCYNWNALIRRIRELNKDAIIVAVSFHNPLVGMTGEGWGDFAALIEIMAALSEVYISPINMHMAYGPYAFETHFCDISELPMDNSADGIHPARPGHAWIAEQIEALVLSLFPCEHPETELCGVVEPTSLSLGYTGNTVCTDCGQTLSRGRAVSLRDVCQHDKGTYTVGDVKPTTKTTGLSGTVLCKNCGAVLENSVILPKLPCTHESTRLVGAVKATKLTAGYSGDEYCKDCGKLVHKGSIVPCTCDHSRTTVVGAVKATLLHPGFSGNTVCRDCGKIVATGETTYYKLFGKR